VKLVQYVSIGVNKKAVGMVDFLANELELNINNEHDYCIDKTDMNSPDLTIPSVTVRTRDGFECSRQDADLTLSISKVLSEFIIKNFEEKLIIRIINTNYCYFNAPEKKDICTAALKIIRVEDGILVNSLFRLRRKNMITNRIIDYLKTSNILILDGFINFRLKDYLHELEDIVDRAVDDFLMEREYKEFIKLLKYFVEMQEPRYNEIDLLQNPSGKYFLMDKSGRDITSECLQELNAGISRPDLSQDDLLVSSLITLAPRKIVVHNAESFRNSILLETVKSVFAGKIIICRGCSVCESAAADADSGAVAVAPAGAVDKNKVTSDIDIH